MAITVQDIIPLKPETVEKLDQVIGRLQEMTKEYNETEDLAPLEALKREFNADLQYMATLFAKIKRYKGPNHTYLEQAIKRIKAEAIDILVSNGKSVSAAEKEVYSHPYYMDRMVVAENLIQYCIKVELLYDNFCYTLQCIVQSLSLAGKDFQNTRSTG